MNIVSKWFRDRESKKRGELQEIIMSIGYFYLEQVRAKKHIVIPQEEDYKEAWKRLSELKITQVEKRNKNIIITLCRPGLLIGRRGSNIEALKKYLHSCVKFNEIELKEEKYLEYLYPMSPEEAHHAITGE